MDKVQLTHGADRAEASGKADHAEDTAGQMESPGDPRQPGYVRPGPGAQRKEDDRHGAALSWHLSGQLEAGW